MFTYDKKAGVYWFSTTPREDYQEFNLVGVVSFNDNHVVAVKPPLLKGTSVKQPTLEASLSVQKRES